MHVEAGAWTPPDPFALAELSQDVRPGDYATSFVRQATHLSPLAEPICVCATSRPPWLEAVAAEPGVRVTTLAGACRPFTARETSRHGRGCGPRTRGESRRVAPMQGTIVASTSRGRRGPRRPAAARHRGHEDGARGRRAGGGGVVRRLAVAAGDTVYEGHPLAFIEETEVAAVAAVAGRGRRPRRHPARPGRGARAPRRRRSTTARPDAVARRRRTGQRTARENVADLCDPGSFVEYGAARHRRPAPPPHASTT